MKKHILCFVKEDDGSDDTTLYPTPSVIFVMNNVEATAATDATLLLTRERQQMSASLALTGRTIREHELALAFSDPGTWSLLGDGAQVRRSDCEREALTVLQVHGPMTPSEYAHVTGRKHTSVKVELNRMD